jgi:hypothetical protein
MMNARTANAASRGCLIRRSEASMPRFNTDGRSHWTPAAVPQAELPQKMGYDAVMWTSVMHGLYLYFAIIGGPVEVAAVIAALVLAVRYRGRPGGRLAAVGAACFVIAMAWWFAVINTANSVIGKWALSAVPADWERWRMQWEFGHAAHFVLAFAGLLDTAAGNRQRRRRYEGSSQRDSR